MDILDSSGLWLGGALTPAGGQRRGSIYQHGTILFPPFDTWPQNYRITQPSEPPMPVPKSLPVESERVLP